MLQCVFPAYRLFTSATNGSTACSCPLECSHLSYHYTISQAPISHLYMTNVLQAFNISPSVQLRDLVVVRLFFSTLTYEEISLDAAYTFFALLSDIGGSLGLLLGATLLTAYEVVEFVFEFGVDVMRARNRKCQLKRESKKVMPVTTVKTQ